MTGLAGVTTSRPVSVARTPYFTATVDAEVEIDPQDLEAAGWVYVGSGSRAAMDLPEGLMPRLERWHKENHSGPWPWCTDDLCTDVNRLAKA